MEEEEQAKEIKPKKEKKQQSTELKPVEKLQLSENQLKVIKDKYLKDSPTPEAWMMLVAGNIALGELMYLADEKDIFENTNYGKETFNLYENEKANTFLLHKDLLTLNERNKNFLKLISNLNNLAKEPKYKEQYEKIKIQFYNMMANFEFLPNSPTLMNAGRALQQLSGCYVLPIGDSIEEIFDSLKNMALIHKSGGGTGFSFSRLRPAGDEVLTTKGISSGPISFMSMFDKSTDVVKQGGTRRGANMGILRYDHPDIINFITCKKKPGSFENFNISVAIDEKFMDCVRKNQEYDLINPHTNKTEGKANAKDIFEMMIKTAWETGDPGYVVIDKINNSDSNPTPALGEIESTNPCGEQPLLPYEVCNLGSINLSKFVNKKGKDIDYEKLKACVFLSVHFLDNVIDVNNYPLEKIEYMGKLTRRIGMGVMGWAETLAMMQIPYNSNEALTKAEEVMRFVNENALKASEELALTRGVPPAWKNSIYDEKGTYFRGQNSKPRNLARTTIAPTGTIGITAGLQGAGIEPFFAIAYTRYNAAGIDYLKRGEKPLVKDTFYEVNPLFKKVAQENNFFGMKEEELWKKIDSNHKSAVGINEIPLKIQKSFFTAHDLNPVDHLKMQIAFQKFTNNAVSKTVNLRKEATVDNVRQIYFQAYELGVKGITIYRDGSKDLQILNLGEKKKEKKEYSFGETSTYYEIQTGYGPLHVNINYDEDGPRKIFLNLTPTGTEISGLTTATGILLSKYFQLGGDPVKILKHLNSIKGDKPIGFGPKRIDSIAHAISKALRDHLIKTGKLTAIEGQTMLTEPNQQQETQQKHLKEPHETTLYCPKCFSPNVEMQAGCSKPTCYDCGYSECS